MNDFWNDPPDECTPEVDCPECGSGDVCALTGNELILMMGCDECRHRWFERSDFRGLAVPGVGAVLDFGDIEPPEGVEFVLGIPAVPDECPHGRPWGDCNDCMVAGDLAYDAARERGR